MTQATDELPWLGDALASLQAAALAGRLPQGLLVHESPGAGGLRLVKRVAQLVLCSGAQPACGLCSGCQRVASGDHPDLLRLSPAADSKSQQITVDAVREACEQLVMTSYEGRGSVAVIQPADAMNHNAANCLLKTLEEPRRGLHIVLLTARPSALPATIHSRCQTLRLRAPARPEAIAWLHAQRPSADWAIALDATAGSVLEASDYDPAWLRQLRDDTWRALAEARRGTLDVVRTAEAWSRDELLLRLNCIETCLTQRLLSGPEIASQLPEMRTGAHLPGAVFDINMRQCYVLLDAVREVRAGTVTTLNKALAVERLLWRFAAAAQ